MVISPESFVDIKILILMGNIVKNTECEMDNKNVPVEQFQFHEPFENDSINGLYFNNIYVPEEIVENILSHITPKDLLGLTLVCKKWCNIIKSENLWRHIYNKHFINKPKKLPWYVFYCFFVTNNFVNMLRNGNGQENFEHWTILRNYGDRFIIENPPSGCDELPQHIADFNGCTSCFATSFENCCKAQIISLKEKRLLRYIINKFMPHIYASEWVAGRFDCGCVYKLSIKGFANNSRDLDSDDTSDDLAAITPTFHVTKTIVIKQWKGKEWQKVEVLVKDYPRNITKLIFEHEGSDTQFWKGHYGSKMAGEY
ncbi:hypothetical protein NQ317_018124 [Molorchus minor]|uniref:Uncharacterized protein n=1 Tax=Molorchus minor TaxID=1323400 RepID=A0ABQ9J0K8_9CUCU|nr:hypothetical protein NQ317_018124 [Molorchus minor]